MEPEARREFTEIVQALADGGPAAADRLVPVLYEELRRMAAARIRQERPGHTLDPTGLVHEVYLKLVDQERVRWQSRAHFLAWAARLMRQVLINYAKKRKALKRGGGMHEVPLEDLAVSFEERAVDLAALDDGLKKLAEQDERKSRIVELRFFGGLTIQETAEVVGVSHATVEREWRFARAWLQVELLGERGGG